MADTYVLLSKTTVGAAGASSINFTNIPQTGYTDLLIKISGRCTRAADQSNLVISFNDSTSNFTGRYLEGINTTATSATFARFIGAVPAANGTANTFGSVDVYIPNYTSSSYKSFSADAAQEGNSTNVYLELNAGLWSNTAAITSISITSNSSDNFVQYTTAYLYGISNVNQSPTSAPKATGGDIITNDGTYWYHAFRSNGTFAPNQSLTCDYLVVAGGGGAIGGGGGAGGLLTATSQSIAANSYAITVGAGGVGAAYAQNSHTNGSNSSFNSTIATGGGKSGSTDASPQDGQSGGSGGGAGGAGGTNVGGAATPSGQGYAGGNGANPNGAPYPGGGGGGAGAVGTNATTSAAPYAGNGGIGATSAMLNAMGSATSTGELYNSNYYYAGGGAGGSGYDNTSNPPAQGGKGGGAVGKIGSSNGNSGTANTGGGAGGATQVVLPRTGGNGGSGIVIIRYAM